MADVTAVRLTAETDGTPDETLAVTLNMNVIVQVALLFCYQPETFWLFRDWAVKWILASPHPLPDWAAWLGDMQPRHIADIARMLLETMPVDEEDDDDQPADHG